jgi:hypothetical protein
MGHKSLLVVIFRRWRELNFWTRTVILAVAITICYMM